MRDAYLDLRRLYAPPEGCQKWLCNFFKVFNGFLYLPVLVFVGFTISEQLAELHWLRIPERVDFKLACFAFKCVHEEAPSYLQDCLPPVKVHNERNLRSKTQRKLDGNFCKSAFVKNSSFTFQAPRIVYQIILDLKMILLILKLD